MENALYEIASMRLFDHLTLDGAIPDRTTIMNFRHLVERHQLARTLLETINQWLTDSGVMMKQGTLVDASIIEAPTSTKNKKISEIWKCIRPKKAIIGILAVRPESRLYFCSAGNTSLTEPVVSPIVPYPECGTGNCAVRSSRDNVASGSVGMSIREVRHNLPASRCTEARDE